MRVTETRTADLDELAALAARTFPLACPPSTRAEDIASFIEANLSAKRFADYLRDPGREVFVARCGDRLLGYAMVIHHRSADPDVRRVITDETAAELSKIYVLPEYHGGPAAAALIGAVVDHAQTRGADSVWLGVNQQNARAQRFYAKHGFIIRGTKRFQLGAGVENDYVMVREPADAGGGQRRPE